MDYGLRALLRYAKHSPVLNLPFLGGFLRGDAALDVTAAGPARTVVRRFVRFALSNAVRKAVRARVSGR